ncbi:hypothetical protein [Leptolyngbya sp. 7M]|uniref:hypothetical protein n=1 Tax=Leptolyngbya sp. 7M TaxID=2812896 RepID=UPI001B8B67E4|nr:hypothetical protein [Leptolyngbya sp. 7M]QYO67863.1 hypothetical protein JVX88_14405 [Leptolyngbya sp. 7M]
MNGGVIVVAFTLFIFFGVVSPANLAAQDTVPIEKEATNGKTSSGSDNKDSSVVANSSDDADSNIRKPQNNWYSRPTPNERRKRYINSVVGPVALIRYATVSGVLTARNAPKEWGGKIDGFGKRFASNLGESVISNTVKYGLDEVLEVDSRFYLSRDRSVSARFRNAIFSTVTARNKEGKRVFGLPKLAGNLAGNVISATTWYPERYGLSHGLKGSAINLAVDAGVGLFREFVWKK